MSGALTSDPGTTEDGGRPAVTSTRRLTADARRRQLFDVALSLFAEHGYAATTMDDIAEEAGVSIGAHYRFNSEKQEIYDEIDDGLPPGSPQPRPGELDEQTAEIEASGLFDVVHVRHFDWETVYDADGYIALLNTFSGHIAMQDWQRDRLYGEIRRRLDVRPDRTLRRHWGAVLHVARRKQ